MLFCQHCGRSLPNTSAVCECQRKPAPEPANDGGPAFPISQEIGRTEDGRPTTIFSPGLSLRDWFAGQALAGMAGVAP